MGRRVRASRHAGLDGVQERHGRDAVAVYLGNPNAHTIAGPFYGRPLISALATRNLFSASTVDQMPMHVACGFTFGDPMAIPVPDLDRTDLLLMLGANPWESNGSLCTAPDFPGRLEAIASAAARSSSSIPGGRRPPRTPTSTSPSVPAPTPSSCSASSTPALRQDLAPVGVPASPASRSCGRWLPAVHARGRGPGCGVTCRESRLARELAAAPTAAVYGRIGTCTVEFGTLANWLVDVRQRPDRQPGPARAGPCSPRAARATGRRAGRGFATGRWHSRVRGLPEVNGELPAATLADEIETPGEGQVRALVTLAGNPVLSHPAAPASTGPSRDLEFMVCVDPYLNETTRHADVILPPPPRAQRRTTTALPRLRGAQHGGTRRRCCRWTTGATASAAILARLAGSRRRPGRRPERPGR